MTRLLILIAVAFVLVSAALAWMLATYLPGVRPHDLFLVMSPVMKLVGLILVVMAGFGAVYGFRRDAASVRNVVILALIVAVLGAAYGELNTHFGTLIDNEVSFATLAPWRAESLAILALGQLGALMGLVILRLRSDRRGV